jgi:hypothetical protein
VRAKGIVIALLAAALVLPLTAASLAPAKPALTSSGQLLQSFEGLLKHRYGSRQVCAYSDGASRWHFSATTCSPLSTYSPYEYTFREPRNTDLRVSRRSFRGLVLDGGARAVLVGGHPIGCDAWPGMYLGADANFSLRCVSPDPGDRRSGLVRATSASVSLTATGRMLRSLDELVFQQYGVAGACAHMDGYFRWSLTSAPCRHARPYFPTFTSTRTPALRLSPLRHGGIGVGNAAVVLVSGHPVLCSLHRGMYLTRVVPPASLSLGCFEPQ